MRWCRIGLLVLGLFAFVPPALAQSKDDSQKALALGHEALAAYNKGSWAEARAKFAEADRLAHSPVFVLYLARAARNAGDLAAAKEAYDRLVNEVVPDGAPAPWSAAVASGKQERAELEKQIAQQAAAAATTNASTSPTATTAAAVPTTTGAPATTGLPATTTATATTGAPTASSTAPFPAATAAPTSNTAVPPGGPAQGERGSVAPGLAVMGIGVAGIGVGIGLFAHAKSMADGVLERCAGKAVCPAADRAVKDSAVGFADGATAAFAVGGALLATGAVLLVVRPGGKAAPAKTGLTVQPGWASIRVSGSF